MTTEVRRTVASQVRAEVAAAGRTPQWLAEQIGMSARALQKRLTMRADFTVIDLADIAHALGIEVSDLVPPAQ